jgi:hypothetical protein
VQTKKCVIDNIMAYDKLCIDKHNLAKLVIVLRTYRECDVNADHFLLLPKTSLKSNWCKHK